MALVYTTQSFFYTGTTGSFTIPNGVTAVSVSCWGGGGGGGGQNLSSDGGGGGGGGAYAGSYWTVTPGSIYEYYVGYGGAAGVGTTQGTNGGHSKFSGSAGTVLAAGGRSGSHSTGLPPSGGWGGLDSECVGDFKFGGAGGTAGRNSATGRGGPGGNGAGLRSSIGSPTPKVWTTNTADGVGSTWVCVGGDGGGVNGAPGTHPTGSIAWINGNFKFGGGGGGAAEGTNIAGGRGAEGYIMIEYYINVIESITPVFTIWTFDD